MLSCIRLCSPDMRIPRLRFGKKLLSIVNMAVAMTRGEVPQTKLTSWPREAAMRDSEKWMSIVIISLLSSGEKYMLND